MTNYTFVGKTDTGWNTAGNWSPSGIPGTGDSATINGSVVIGGEFIVSNTGSIMGNSGPINVGTLDLTHGATLDAVGITVPTGGVLEGSGSVIVDQLTSGAAIPGHGPIENDGVIRADGSLFINAQIATNTGASGAMEIINGGTLELYVPNPMSGETITADGNGRLIVDNARGFGDTLAVAAGGTLDLGVASGEIVRSVSITGSTLTLQSLQNGAEDFALAGPGYSAKLLDQGGNHIHAQVFITPPAVVAPPPPVPPVTVPPVTAPPATVPPTTAPPATTPPAAAPPPADVPPAPPATTPPPVTAPTGTATPPPVASPPDATQAPPPVSTPPANVPSATVPSTTTPTPGRVGLTAPPDATSGSAGATAPAPPPPAAAPPIASGSPTPASAPPAQPSGPVIANDGMTPTPLSPAEVSMVNLAANLHPAAGGASTFFSDGSHLGSDFDTLGSAIGTASNSAAANQTITDMKQLLSAYVADPVGLAGRGIPGQFVIDVVNTGLKAISIGSAPLDHAYGGALTQFFGAEQSVMLTAAH